MDEHPYVIDVPPEVIAFLDELRVMVDELRENEWIDAAAHAILRAKLLELESVAASDPMVRAGLAHCMQACEPSW